MNKQFKLKIVTPERLVLEDMVDRVILPTTEGEITVMAGHIPLIAKLSAGDVVAVSMGEYIPMALVGGFAEVKKEDGMTIVAVLADFVEHVSSITDEVVAEAKEKAKILQQMADKNEVVDFEHFEVELARSLTRIKISDKWKNRKYR
jgi:F-type H+-transporting ATPase subunit epsilon